MRRQDNFRHSSSKLTTVLDAKVLKTPSGKGESETRSMYWAILFTQALCVVFTMIRTFAPKPVGLMKGDGRIGCPRVTLCSNTFAQMLLLAVSRSAAYSMYPPIVLVFITKCNALRTFLDRSFLSIYIPFHDLHSLHVHVGKFIACIAWAHGSAHLARWVLLEHLDFIYSHPTGRTGIIALFMLPLIALPMAYEPVRKKMTYERRKALHVWCSMILGLCLMFHAPKAHIFYVLVIVLVIYLLDLFVCMFFLTYKVDSTEFKRLERGTQLSFDNPDGFRSWQVGYVYVNIPWIAKNEWHAFSLYPQPEAPDTKSSVCIAATGDWTKKLHEEVVYSTTRSCFVSGPYTSPYATATDFDNLVVVASGIGITPAVSIVASAKSKRRVNLIWITRDASMVEFYLSTVEFDNDAFTMIYYTGPRKLVLEETLPPQVFIFHRRPILDKAIRGIIYGIEMLTGLPENMVQTSRALQVEMLEVASLLRGSEKDDATKKLKIVVQHALLSSSVDEVFEQFLLVGMGSKHAAHLNAAAVQKVVELYGGSLTEVEAKSSVDMLSNDRGVLSKDLFFAFCKEALNEISYRDQPRSSGTFTSMDNSNKSVLGTIGEETTQETTTEGTLRIDKLSGETLAAYSVYGATNPDVVDQRTFMRDVGSRLGTWQVLYCGGAQPVVDTLKAFTKQHGISFRVEKFDW